MYNTFAWWMEHESQFMAISFTYIYLFLSKHAFFGSILNGFIEGKLLFPTIQCFLTQIAPSVIMCKNSIGFQYKLRLVSILTNPQSFSYFWIVAIHFWWGAYICFRDFFLFLGNSKSNWSPQLFICSSILFILWFIKKSMILFLFPLDVWIILAGWNQYLKLNSK